MNDRPHYISGRPWGCCDVCGFTVRHDTLRKRWDGFMVCADDYDPPPPELNPRPFPAEGLPIRDARPDLGNVLGPNLTTAADL